MKTPYQEAIESIESQRRKRNDRWKSRLVALGKPFKRLGSYLGPSGIIGAATGFMFTAGPVGLVAGAVAGRNYRGICGWINDNATVINGARVNAKEFEKIDAGARYSPPAPASATDPGVVRAASWIGDKLGNPLDRIETLVSNSRRYANLKKSADALSDRAGRYVTPKDVYDARNEELERKKKLGSLRGLEERLYTHKIARGVDPATLTPTERDNYNALVARRRKLNVKLGLVRVPNFTFI
ncbi:MAG: hypothetical protein ABIG28_02215 [archaeon]